LPLRDHDAFLLGLGTALIVVVATADFYLPPYVVFSLGHACIILIALLARSPLVALALATLATIASFAPWMIDGSARYDFLTIANLGLVVAAIWIVAALVYFISRVKPGVGTSRRSVNRDNVYEALFNGTFQFVAALDLNGKVVDANQTLRDFAGLSSNEIQSMPIWMLPIFQNNEEIQERLKENVRKAAEGDFSRDEFIVSGVGQQSTVIDFSLKPIRREDGAIEQIIMEARDITETRTQQEMLVQAQKMEAVGQLTAGVAHDFNNLLTVIVGNLELLEKRFEGDERFLDRLQRATNAAFRGQALTQQLLAFSRRQSLSPSVVDINTLLQQMSQLYDVLGDNITVEFDLTDHPIYCYADPNVLEAALLNIAINARDAMPDGGVIRFHSERTVLGEYYHGKVSDLPPGSYICLTISDTGEGMSEDTVVQAFDPFFTTKPEGKGTGLGLSMVYGFVKQSGGDVKIYSEKGKGTTLRLYLPETDKAPPEPDDEQSGHTTDLEHEKISVLLVDDDETIRLTILDALAPYGYDIDVAANGDSAIDLIRSGKTYDLVVTDVVMEGQAGGAEVAREARASMPEVAVVFCSGFPRQNLEGDDASVDGAFFLPKPFHNHELVKMIENALSRARRISGLGQDGPHTEK
jgi:PAS domain S-box-containing protein